MLLTIYPENPNPQEIKKVVDVLLQDGVIIYPTDTVYGMACSLYSKKGMERLGKLKGVKGNKIDFSIICHDLKNLSDFTTQLEKGVYRILKASLPGPFTFILPANNQVPKLFGRKKDTVGIRVPDNNITREIVRSLGHPMVSTSVHDEDEIIDYTTDPSVLYEHYHDKVDIIVDGGFGKNEASTIVDCTGVPEIVRQGLGVLDV